MLEKNGGNELDVDQQGPQLRSILKLRFLVNWQRMVALGAGWQKCLNSAKQVREVC